MELLELRSALLEVADSDKAPGMVSYMQHQFQYLGVRAGPRRTASGPLLRAAKTMAPAELLSFADALWSEPEREFHYVGMDMVRAGAKNLDAIHLGNVRQLIERTPWWDTVDSLAIHSVGTLVTNHPELVEEMDEWIESSNIWIARTAILHQLMYRDRTDVNRLFTYSTMWMDSGEFFIRKAIGWALRQYARTDSEAVLAFVEQNEDSLSGLSKREALKNVTSAML